MAILHHSTLSEHGTAGMGRDAVKENVEFPSAESGHEPMHTFFSRFATEVGMLMVKLICW